MLVKESKIFLQNQTYVLRTKTKRFPHKSPRWPVTLCLYLRLYNNLFWNQDRSYICPNAFEPSLTATCSSMMYGSQQHSMLQPTIVSLLKGCSSGTEGQSADASTCTLSKACHVDSRKNNTNVWKQRRKYTERTTTTNHENNNKTQKKKKEKIPLRTLYWLEAHTPWINLLIICIIFTLFIFNSSLLDLSCQHL